MLFVWHDFVMLTVFYRKKWSFLIVSVLEKDSALVVLASHFLKMKSKSAKKKKRKQKQKKQATVSGIKRTKCENSALSNQKKLHLNTKTRYKRRGT